MRKAPQASTNLIHATGNSGCARLRFSSRLVVWTIAQWHIDRSFERRAGACTEIDGRTCGARDDNDQSTPDHHGTGRCDWDDGEGVVTGPYGGMPGYRFAFAPHPEPFDDMFYRIHVFLEDTDGSHWSVGGGSPAAR